VIAAAQVIDSAAIWLVKWDGSGMGLGYEYCTWEKGSELMTANGTIMLQLVKEFNTRCS
jgi:hypothetical protein